MASDSSAAVPAWTRVAAVASRGSPEAGSGLSVSSIRRPVLPEWEAGRPGRCGCPGGECRSRFAPSAAPVRRQRAAPKRPATGDSSIRVSVEKVDQLINLVGELVITHAMLAESASELDPVIHERIFSGLSNLERNSRDLQQAVMSIRMMPISFVFNRFPRVVRDTAANLGKKVNADADRRGHRTRQGADRASGRSAQSPGAQQHRSRHRAAGAAVARRASRRPARSPCAPVIAAAAWWSRCSDDGAGLNREKLLAKAAQQGIPMPEHPTRTRRSGSSSSHAGFSTAEKVTDISGRGVGMDVVRRNIEEMNGRVEIESCAGTRHPYHHPPAADAGDPRRTLGADGRGDLHPAA